MGNYGNIIPEAMSMSMIFKKQRAIQQIPLDEIFPNPFQPRRVFDEKELFALGESIKQNGLIQPISVRKMKNGYELIAGERRLRACKIIGRKSIDAIVYDIDDEDSATWALIENLQRSDLSPFDEAEAMAKLIAAWSVTREEAARRFGLSASGLSNKLRLLKLEEPVRKIITKANLTERHARELLRIDEPTKREDAARHIAEKNLNVAQTEKYVTKILSEKQKRKAPKYVIKDLRIFINTIEHAVEVMNMAGISAMSTVTENDEQIIYSVSVPKDKAFRIAADAANKDAAPVCSAFAPSVI